MDEKNKKVPINIRFYGRFYHVQSEVGEPGRASFGSWCPIKYLPILEEEISTVITVTKRNAMSFLRLLKEEGEKTLTDKEILERIVNYRGKLKDLFILVYSKNDKEKIEPHLGKYNKLEKRLLKEEYF